MPSAPTSAEDFAARVVEANDEADHVHLLVEYPPTVAISKLVNSLKGVSSRLLRQSPPEIAQRYYQGVLWSSSYFAASRGGAPLSIIRQHVRSPKKKPVSAVRSVPYISALKRRSFTAPVVIPHAGCGRSQSLPPPPQSRRVRNEEVLKDADATFTSDGSAHVLHQFPWPAGGKSGGWSEFQPGGRRNPRAGR